LILTGQTTYQLVFLYSKEGFFMNDWSAPPRPAAYAEESLLTAILDNVYPPGSNLPAERELAVRLGVTRPTLREALRRLESDGWLLVQQGKPTRVKDFWKEGGLNVLSSLVRFSRELPPNFIPHLLEVRLAMAPAYTRAAVEKDPAGVDACLEHSQDLEDTPAAYAAMDWKLHNTLTSLSANPIYSLILNGFAGFYEQMAGNYFVNGEARTASKAFYRALAQAAQRKDAVLAERLTRYVMHESITFWEKTRIYPA
jgi:GntR family transcriptional regulator, negative regulator for fad regulon and positive regulator of fabA